MTCNIFTSDLLSILSFPFRFAFLAQKIPANSFLLCNNENRFLANGQKASERYREALEMI
jgi:hypothetical protein